MIKDKICQVCGAQYNPNSPGQKYCFQCGPVIGEKKRRIRKKRELERRKELRKQRRLDHGKEFQHKKEMFPVGRE